MENKKEKRHKSEPLSVTHPEIAAQWHPIKNGNLTPEMVTHGMNKRVWWQCEKGHEWAVAIIKRTSGSGCPVCAGKRVQTGFNDLATVNPKAAAQWHFAKNGNLTPEQVSATSCQVVWWKCEKGHEWKAQIGSRLYNGCPYCGNQKLLKGFNDLATTHPELAKEWQKTKNKDLAPDMVMAGSNRKVWWQCEKGHEWETSLAMRKKGTGCPYCTNRQVLKGFNDLSTIHPDIAKTWRPTKNEKLTPEMVIAGSHKTVWWQCEQGHEWEATVASRSGGSGCPYCSNKEALAGFNDLATVHPQLIKEWNWLKNGNLSPEQCTPCSSQKVWWICERGHEWEATISHRTKRTGCPVCAGKRVIPGYNDLKTLYPEIAKEWHPTKNGKLTPEMVTIGSGRKVWWQCEYGHEWETAVLNRTNGSECLICRNKQVLAGYNDLKTLYPAIATQWHPTKNKKLRPSDVTPGSNKKVWWICDKGHEWYTSPNNRLKGTGALIVPTKRF